MLPLRLGGLLHRINHLLRDTRQQRQQRLNRGPRLDSLRNFDDRISDHPHRPGLRVTPHRLSRQISVGNFLAPHQLRQQQQLLMRLAVGFAHRDQLALLISLSRRHRIRGHVDKLPGDVQRGDLRAHRHMLHQLVDQIVVRLHRRRERRFIRGGSLVPHAER